MTTLRTYANLWTLSEHPGAGRAEWTFDQKVAAVAAAGFDGVMGEPGQGIGLLAAKHGLAFVAFGRLDAPDDFHEILSKCRAEGAVVLQVHLGWHDTSAGTALDLALRLHAASNETGVEAVIETHRDTCTDTPEKTETLRRQFRAATGGRELPVLLDFSHHAVVKHLSPPFGRRLLSEPEFVRQVKWHHLRPFNGHHAQIPVLSGDGSLAPEMADWLLLADEIFRLMKSSSLNEVWICPEIGPLLGGYGLSAFPPSWQQAVTLREVLKRHWESL